MGGFSETGIVLSLALHNAHLWGYKLLFQWHYTIVLLRGLFYMDSTL